ncbi:MAG TPA: glycosyltransferase [Polyangia bacterium]|nr:glycosyltransferase [Polyangia bacterium]
MSSPAKVLYIVDGLGLSGKTKAMVDLIAGLGPDRFSAHVVSFDEGAETALDRRLRGLRVDVTRIPCPDRLNLGVVARLAGLVRRLRPDVIHCYNPRTMLYGGIVARLTGVRAVLGSLSAFACLTPDGNYPFLPQKLFSASPRNRLRNRAVSWLMRVIVTVSPSLGRGFCRYNGIDERRLRVVPYGVDVARFAAVTADQIAAFRAGQGLARDAIVIGSVGRLVEQKDYPTQLRAFAQAAAKNPNVVMLLVGDGPLRGELEGLVRSLGIAERVRFAGHSDEIPVALRAMDVYVMASKFEPYGVALLEAKAAGTAIVATAVNEIAEILGEGEPGGPLGVLVPAAEPAAMAEAFVALAADGARRRELGARAARDAAVRHNLPAVIETYQNLYDELRGTGAREMGFSPAA